MTKFKKFNVRIHPEYDYVDLKEYFENLCDQKYIKKNTFSILYHQMFNLINTYTFKDKGYKYINLSYGHIILLSYIMGFINGHEAG